MTSYVPHKSSITQRIKPIKSDTRIITSVKPSLAGDRFLVGRSPTLAFPGYFVSNVRHVQWAIPQTRR